MILLFSACSGPPASDDDGAPAGHALDDVLRFDQIQARGTHNSYHVQTSDLAPWAYDHLPLDRQLGEQGVRQFELDVSWDEALGAHAVFHVPLLDEGTTCATLVDCAATLEGWSRAHPEHHPILILVETKDGWNDLDGPAHLDALDAELLEAWPRERLITPDDLLAAGAPDLRTALADEGWPTLGALRSRALFVLHDGGGRRDAYVEDLAGRPMFPDAYGDVDLPFAAYHSMNDPWDERIAEVVGLGHLVRTRADVDTLQAREEDPSMRDQALASGAQFVSTDFPAPTEGTSYWLEVPGGTPSRCNPLTAPTDCTSVDVEDPAQL
jgi:hypothetical protein